MFRFITPNWAAPSHIKAVSTTRLNGVSKGAYHGLNLGSHVDDNIKHVLTNRASLAIHFAFDNDLYWLNQTHSTTLVALPPTNKAIELHADAAWTSAKNQPCIAMTADCLPVLVTDKKGTFVCAIHAGWRGLCDGIIEKSIQSICNNKNVKVLDLLVWLGPCISKEAFVVGDDVRREFIKHHSKAIEAFRPHKSRWLADLHQLAQQRLSSLNVLEITYSDLCTFKNHDLFYSYRRDGKTGRMATLIWIT
ncbi:MAG: peptidoglycan editing factor PgeF [Psychromonas sp.]|nr:peptidoglycan editing factor PgeF [Psychromonas sp.]